MANFPTSLDNFTNPVSGNTLDSPSHSLQHSDANDAIEAIEAKLGVGASPAGSATAGQVLTISAAGTSGWSTPVRDGLVQVVPTSVAVGSGSGSVDANGAVTFSGASSVSLNGCFSSNYDNYFLVSAFTKSTGGEVRVKGRTAGSDNSNSNYNYQLTESANTTNNAVRGTSQTSGYLGYTDGATDENVLLLDINNPFATKTTAWWSRFNRSYNTTGITIMQIISGFNTTTSFDGISIIPAAGNITGTVRVYGYRN